MVFRTSEFYHKYLSEYLLSHYPDQRPIKWWYFQKEPSVCWILRSGSLTMVVFHLRIIQTVKKMLLTIQNCIGICMIIPVYLHDNLDESYVAIEVEEHA